MSKEVKELIKKVGQVYKDGSSGAPGIFYHPIPFPEYLDVPVHKANCIEEIQELYKNYDFEGKTVVEIGSAGGFFTFNIAKTAKQVIAYEADPEVRAVTEAIRKEKGIRNVHFDEGGFDPYDKIPPETDCVLMLNVHMWLVKQFGFETVTEMLKNIAKTGATLFFQTAHAESNGMFLVKELKNLDDILDHLSDCGFDPKLIKTTSHDHKPRFLIKG